MNYMEQVAKMLGVELEEEFQVEEYDDDYIFKLTKDGLRWMGTNGWQSGYFSLEDILCDRIEIVKKPVIDETERKYLSAVIKPFRDRVKCISKNRFDGFERIFITYFSKLGNKDYILDLPAFEEGTMYKGMEVCKHYTLDELGL